MKKIILTTEQLNKITEYVSSDQLNVESEIGEEISSTPNNQYEQECEFDLSYYGTTYKGMEISHIETSPIRVNFLIELESRSWGIKGVYVYNCKGPEEINLLVGYYPEDSEDWEEIEVPLKLNWDSANEESSNDAGYIGIDQELELELVNDENGDLVVKQLVVRTFTV
jgi:hypothetical protein